MVALIETLPRGQATRIWQWHVGCSAEFISGIVGTVVEVQADGDELTHILANCTNVPYPTNQAVVRWYGDLAKIVVQCMK